MAQVARSKDISEQLHLLVVEACKHKFGTIEYQQSLTQIIRLIVQSGEWKDNAPEYADALQQTWMYFCRNLCEATTGDKYDPHQSSVITWLNAHLKQRLQDGRLKQAALTQLDLLEIKAPWDVPVSLEAIRKWVQTDPDKELSSIHIQGHPKVTCQVLILRRLPPETSWQTLAVEFGLSVSTLSSFYRHQCIPRLRNLPFAKAREEIY